MPKFPWTKWEEVIPPLRRLDGVTWVPVRQELLPPGMPVVDDPEDQFWHPAWPVRGGWVWVPMDSGLVKSKYKKVGC